MMRRRFLAVICASSALLGACSDLDEFRTDSGEIYTGTVIGTEEDGECAPERSCSFIRRGFPAGMKLEMTFRPEDASSDPGTLTSDDSQCGAPSFDGTPLLPIAPLAHDQLSLYDFPGGGRIRNYMFLARPEDGPMAGREPMIFVSLIRGGDVEVRIIAGPGRDCLPEECAACDFFGVFRLEKAQP